MPNNVGVQPISCKALDNSNGGSTSGVLACLSWCGAQGATITQNSWGAGAFSLAVRNQLVSMANVVHVFSSGNTLQNLDTNPTSSYPPADSANVPNMVVRER